MSRGGPEPPASGAGIWRRDSGPATGQEPAGEHVELGTDAVGGVSDLGKRHRQNEDALALAVLGEPRSVVAVVCDGVSSSEHPERASVAAARTASAVLVEELCASGSDTDQQAATRAAVAAAASAAAAEATTESGRPPACTFVSALVSDAAVTVGWVGDSRAYWLAEATASGAGASRRLTTDDSWTAALVEAGLLDEGDAKDHPRANVITRWLGANADEVEPHLVTFQPEGPGVVLICTDGLWHYLDDAETMATVALPLAMQDPLAAALALTQVALDGGGHDNISVALVPVPLRIPD